MATIQKWGNSLALRIPASLAEKMKIAEGTAVEIAVRDGELVIRPRAQPILSLKTLLKSCKKTQLHGETDFGEDVGREVLK